MKFHRSAISLVAVLAAAACQSTVVYQGGGGGNAAASGSAPLASGAAGAGSCDPSPSPTWPCEHRVQHDGGCPYLCEPTAGCATEGAVCSYCRDDVVRVLGIYRCECDEKSRYRCTTLPGCCQGNPSDPSECGDVAEARCVKHRCEPAPQYGTCWVDADCPGTPHGTCIGAVVCPCGASCDTPDQPGGCGM